MAYEQRIYANNEIISNLLSSLVILHTSGKWVMCDLMNRYVYISLVGGDPPHSACLVRFKETNYFSTHSNPIGERQID